MRYHDKNGVEIKGGMTTLMGDGSTELVYETTAAYGTPACEINASNKAFEQTAAFAPTV